MRVVRITGPAQLEVAEACDPVAPVDGLVIAVDACGVCGSDLRRWKEGPSGGKSPPTPGHEVAGRVVEAGPEARGYAVGARIAIGPDIHCGVCRYCARGWYNLCENLELLGITSGLDGGLADFMVVPGRALSRGVVHMVPDALSNTAAALAEPLASVLAAQDRVCIGISSTVVCYGAGPIGLLHAIVAQLAGAQVVVVEPSPTRRALAASLGFQNVVDATGRDATELTLMLTGGAGADVAVCATGNTAAHAAAVSLVRRRGIVVLFGGLPHDDPMTRVDANLVHYRELTVLGSFSYQPRYHEQALGLMRRQEKVFTRLITHEVELADAADAYQLAAGLGALKVMVIPKGLDA